MWGYVLAIFGLGLLCGGWVVLQRLVARDDPQAGSRRGGCASCSCGEAACKNEPPSP